MDQLTRARFERDFLYHPPEGDQTERYAAIREAGKSLAMLIAETSKPSREQSLAFHQDRGSGDVGERRHCPERVGMGMKKTVRAMIVIMGALLLASPAMAGQDNGDTTTGDGGGDVVSCPEGYTARGDECWMKMDGSGNWLDDWQDACGGPCGPGGPGGGVGPGTPGGPPAGGSGGGRGGRRGGVDVVDCAIKVVGSGAGWVRCIVTVPAAGTGLGAALPALTCFAAAMGTAGAVKTCTGN